VGDSENFSALIEGAGEWLKDSGRKMACRNLDAWNLTGQEIEKADFSTEIVGNLISCRIYYTSF
jgi:hypothetical protein